MLSAPLGDALEKLCKPHFAEAGLEALEHVFREAQDMAAWDELFGRVGQVVSALLPLLKDKSTPDFAVARCAARVFGWVLGEPELTSRCVSDRSGASTSLSLLRKGVVQLAKMCLQHESSAVRECALGVLSAASGTGGPSTHIVLARDARAILDVVADSLQRHESHLVWRKHMLLIARMLAADRAAVQASAAAWLPAVAAIALRRCDEHVGRMLRAEEQVSLTPPPR